MFLNAGTHRVCMAPLIKPILLRQELFVSFACLVNGLKCIQSFECRVPLFLHLSLKRASFLISETTDRKLKQFMVSGVALLSFVSFVIPVFLQLFRADQQFQGTF